MTARAPVVVIGIGSDFRHDDGFGPAAIHALEQSELAALDDVELMVLDGEATRLIEAWRDRRMAIVIDAVVADSPAGTVHRVDVGSSDFPPARHPSSSHRVDLPEAVELAVALEMAMPDLVLFGVEPADMSLGVGLSPAVSASLDDVIQEVITCATAQPEPSP